MSHYSCVLSPYFILTGEAFTDNAFEMNRNVSYCCSREYKGDNDIVVKKIYQTGDTVFHHRSNTEKRVENATCSGVFLTNFVTFWWTTVSTVWYYFSNKMIFHWEIKDGKTGSFSSPKHSLINFLFIFLWGTNEFEKIVGNLTCKRGICNKKIVPWREWRWNLQAI